VLLFNFEFGQDQKEEWCLSGVVVWCGVLCLDVAELWELDPHRCPCTRGEEDLSIIIVLFSDQSVLFFD
jgi:hypothetical protein